MKKQYLSHALLLGVLGFCWPTLFVLLFVGFDSDTRPETYLLFALSVYASINLWATILRRRLFPVSLMFWLYVCNFSLLPGYVQSTNGKFFWEPYDAYPQTILLFTCLVIAIGLASFTVGTRFAHSAGLGLKVQGFFARFSAASLEPTTAVYVASTALFVYLAGMIAVKGIPFFVYVRGEGLDVDSSVQYGLLSVLPRSAGFAVILLWVALLAAKARRGEAIPVAAWGTVTIAIGLNAVINYPLALSRFWLFGFLFSAMWIMVPLRTVLMRATFVIAFSVLQVTAFPWFSQITRSTGGIEFHFDAVREYFLFGDFSDLQMTANVVRYIDDVGFLLGHNLLSVLFFFVPRHAWDKAEPLGVVTATHLGYSFTNLSTPIVSELYADFGLGWVAIGMAVFGYVMRTLDLYYDRVVKSNVYLCGFLLVSTIAGYLPIVLRGSLLGVTPAIAALFAALFVLAVLSGRVKLPGSVS